MSKLKGLFLAGILTTLVGCTTLNRRELEKDSLIENIYFLSQNSYLICEDLKYTQQGINKGYIEANPYANLILKVTTPSNLSVAAIGVQILGNCIAYELDKSGNLAKVLNGLISLGEFYAIKNNVNILKENKNLEARLFTIRY